MEKNGNHSLSLSGVTEEEDVKKGLQIQRSHQLMPKKNWNFFPPSSISVGITLVSMFHRKRIFLVSVVSFESSYIGKSSAEYR